MRKKRLAALTTLVLSVTGGLPLATSAAADSSTLYVNNYVPCSDHAADSGSQADPYCTISAAAAVVQPGQTVNIAGSDYYESVDVTHSGTASAPITFVAPNWTTSGEHLATVEGRLRLIGVHDVIVRNLGVLPAPEDTSVLVQDSRNVTLDHLHAFSYGTSTKSPAIRITGQTDGVMVSRTHVSGALGDGIAVEAGVTHTVLTTNPITNALGRGVSVTDAPGTVVTGNTIQDVCGPAVELAGNSAGSTVENNVLMEGAQTNSACTNAPLTDLQVSAASTIGTVADYNAISPKSQNPYSWAGQAEANIASFQGVSGQGSHDVSWTGTYWGGLGAGPLIDSADANAPGELDTDFFGHPRVDDPKVANTGTGVGYYDRGAFEVQDPLDIGLNVLQSTDSTHPLDVTVTGRVNSPWSAATTTLDFGDGSAPVSQPTFPLTHTYSQPGTYTVTLTAADAQGTVRKVSGSADFVAGPIQPNLTLTPYQAPAGSPDLPLRVDAGTAGGAESPWPIAKDTIDFGDGTVVNASANSTDYQHDYALPGTYTVTHTITDDHGRAASTTKTITVGSDYVPLTSPTRILDTRTGLGSIAHPVGPGGVLRLQVTGGAGVPTDGKVTSVLLNLTATNATDSTHITAFPGGSVPTASNLNITPGHDVGNAVLVPVASDGSISLYNNSGTVDLIADVQGYYTTQPQGASLKLGHLQQAVRALDTRNGTGGVSGPVGPGGTINFQVRGQGQLPADAQVAVLNLTVTDGTDSSYVTAAPNGNPPTNSSINFGPGQTVANQVTVPINPDGTVTLYNHTGSVHLIADIQGYYAAAAGTAPVLTVAPTRLLDTRVMYGPLGPDGMRAIKIQGAPGLPDHVSAVLVNLTATNPTADSWLKVFDGQTVGNWNATSNINVTPGATVPNLALVPVGPNGYITVYNHTGSADVIVDLQGYVP